MGKNRIIYRNWADNLSSSPPFEFDQSREAAEADHSADTIAVEVHAAIARLEPSERLLIERYYLQFEEFASIAESLRMSPYRLETLHARAMKKLCKLLGSFVAERFGLVQPSSTRCCICRSPRRSEIERLILSRDPKRPWKVLLKKLRTEFGISIRTYQIVQSHQRFH